MMEKTFDLSDTGTFGSEGFRIGSAGIVDTPLAHGQVSNLALTDLDLRKVLIVYTGGTIGMKSTYVWIHPTCILQ